MTSTTSSESITPSRQAAGRAGVVQMLRADEPDPRPMTMQHTGLIGRKTFGGPNPLWIERQKGLNRGKETN